MEIGSIVECIDDSGITSIGLCTVPKKGNLYTVAGLVKKPRGLGIYIEEIPELILVDYHNRTNLERAPFLATRFVERLPPIVVSQISEMVEAADKKLDWMLYRFKENLDIQTVQLQYGPNYVNHILDAIISEINRDRIIGYQEDGN